MIKQDGLNVTPEQWAVLIHAFKYPGLSQTEIAQRSSKEKTNITRILDVLEKHGYLQRQHDAHDRRMYRIYLTNEGKDLVKRLVPLAESVNTSSRQSLDEQELLMVKTVLKRICTTLEELL